MAGYCNYSHQSFQHSFDVCLKRDSGKDGKRLMMKRYMVIEHFKVDCFDLVYERFEERGRMLPEGLIYLNSWVCREKSICYQLMETDDPGLLDTWQAEWNDLVDFEITPIDSIP